MLFDIRRKKNRETAVDNGKEERGHVKREEEGDPFKFEPPAHWPGSNNNNNSFFFPLSLHAMHAFLFFTANKTGKSIVSRGRVRKKEETGNVKRAAASSFSTFPSLLCYAAAKWRREKRMFLPGGKKKTSLLVLGYGKPEQVILFSLSLPFLSLLLLAPCTNPGHCTQSGRGGKGRRKFLILPPTTTKAEDGRM